MVGGLEGSALQNGVELLVVGGVEGHGGPGPHHAVRLLLPRLLVPHAQKLL